MGISTESEQVESDATAEQGATEESSAADPVSGHGDALPVLAQEAQVVRRGQGFGDLSRSRETLPTVQAAAVAAGGFVAGAAVVGLVTRRQRRSNALTRGRGRQGTGRLGRGSRRSSNAGELVQIVGSRSLLLDVHLLGGRD